jgi:hypothetical protein
MSNRMRNKAVVTGAIAPDLDRTIKRADKIN